MPENQIAILKGHRPEELGLVPDFIDQNDPRPAREQFDANYQHGGGWRPIEGFIHRKGVSLEYPGDPVFHPIATWPLRNELIVMYRHGLVAIFEIGTGKFEVARMD